ncbi:MAG: hypothetical protein Q9222_001352 [Ikaeria aurantiellina]
MTASPPSSIESAQDLRAEVIEGIQEIIDELIQASDQIAGYAVDHIFPDDVILTYSSSPTVLKFLRKAAAKRKFTIIHAQSFSRKRPRAASANQSDKGSDSEQSSDGFLESLGAAGIEAISVPEVAAFAVMSRVHKVILDSHCALADGSLVAAAGSRVLAKAARMHSKPVIVLCGVYKISPVYPFDMGSLIEVGDPGNVIGYQQGKWIADIDVENPVYDYVPSKLVELYITNMCVFAQDVMDSALTVQ